MPRMRWVRLWTQETLYGTTNRELSLEERAIWFELLALAGDSPVPGVICISPDVSFTDSQLSQILGAPEALVRLTVDKLASPEIGKLSLNNSGLIHIVNWSRYQSEFDRTEYQRIYMVNKRRHKREASVSLTDVSLTPVSPYNRREQKGGEGNRKEVYPPPSPPPSPPTPPREATALAKTTTTTTKDIFADTNFARITKAYEAEIGMLTPHIGQELDFLYSDLPPGMTAEAWADWIVKAFNYAANQNKRNLAYIQATLKGWQSQGWQMKSKPKEQLYGKNRENPSESESSDVRAIQAYKRAKQRGDL